MSNTVEILLHRAWEDGTLCGECQHYHKWEEHHPYGSTTAAETLSECRVDAPANCPWVEHELKRRAVQQEEGDMISTLDDAAFKDEK